MIFIPKKRFLLFLLAPLLFFILGLANGDFITLGIVLDCIFIAYGFIDIIMLLGEKAPVVEAEEERIFSINAENGIEFTVTNLSRKYYDFRISIQTPDTWKRITGDSVYTVKPAAKTEIYLVFRPVRRGAISLQGFYYRYSGKRSMFWIQRKVKKTLKIEVIPDIAALKKMIHFTRTNKLFEIGVHKNQYQGMGSEFESLREYQPGENADKIDWKVSTRVGKPVTRIYQMETNNNITFLIDCGRCMTAEQNGINSLDHAINSMLILVHIAIKAGDSINLVFFADKIIAEAYNLKGRSSIQKIRQMCSEVNARMVQSDFGRIFSYVSLKLKRRSYVMVFSDVVDDVQCSIFLKYMHYFTKKHLPLLVLLQDIELSKELEKIPSTSSQLYRGAVASEMYLQRKHSLDRLIKNRIMVIDSLPAELLPPLVNKYYEIKASNML